MKPETIITNCHVSFKQNKLSSRISAGTLSPKNQGGECPLGVYCRGR